MTAAVNAINLSNFEDKNGQSVWAAPACVGTKEKEVQ